MNGAAWKAVEQADRERLSALAESSNETARMARVNISLTLTVALYLALTLLTTTDENLLRNTLVTLPHLQTGIPLDLSYLFAPLVFVYLHGQTLFLLVVLARKVRRFENTLMSLFPNDAKENEARDECREWLSAVSLVQGFVGVGWFADLARGLTWIAAAGIPLVLLFLIDLSFLRYQSTGVSLIHHVCFSADVVGVWVFWRYVYPSTNVIGWTSLLETFRRGFRLHEKFVAGAWMSVKIAMIGSSALSVAFVWSYGWVSSNDPENPMSFLEDLVCPAFSWRGTCRALSVPGATLMRFERGKEPDASLPDVAGSSEYSLHRRLHGIDLQRRSLRFSNLEFAHMKYANLDSANLDGAMLADADLTGATLRGAKLGRVTLWNTDLRDTDLRDADLRYANRRNQAERVERGFSEKKRVMGPNLKAADLRDADLRNAYLIGSNLTDANLSGADLRNADLRLSNLTGADLRGAWVVRSHLEQDQLDLACGNKYTWLPTGYSIPLCDEQ